MTRIIWLLVALLLIFHQDFWYWDDDRLVAGMPIGLTYHIGISVVASGVWLLACLFAWPRELDSPVDPAREDQGGDQ